MQVSWRQVTKGPTDTKCWRALLWRANHPMNGQSLFGGWKGLIIRMSDSEQIWLKKRRKKKKTFPKSFHYPSLPPSCVPLPCMAFPLRWTCKSEHSNGCIHSCWEQWWFRLLRRCRRRINDPLCHLSARLWHWDYGRFDPQREETMAITHVKCSRLVIKRM